jgi:hypothetical protein
MKMEKNGHRLLATETISVEFEPLTSLQESNQIFQTKAQLRQKKDNLDKRSRAAIKFWAKECHPRY